MEPENRPSNVVAEEGEVVMDGPDGLAVSLTPDAAIETSERLLKAGIEARGQRVGADALRDERRRKGLPD